MRWSITDKYHNEKIMNNENVKKVVSEKPLRRGVYLLPNLFTLAALFSGFFSIISSAKGQFDHASWAILVSMVLDSLDGRVARMTHTQSDFGAQLDSLSDLVSFGLAPALLCYFWLLHSFDSSGWLACFIFVACAALRLARFNSAAENTSSRYFRGLNSPMAAGVMTTFVFSADQFGWRTPSMSVVLFILVVCIGLLMVSTFRYRSFKDVNLGGRVPFVVMVFAMLFYVVVTYSASNTLFVIFFTYSMSGPIGYMLLRFKRRRSVTKQSGSEKEDT